MKLKINMAKVLVIVILFISCDETEPCYLKYFEGAIVFPEKYVMVECSPDIYDIAIHFKFKKESISSFIETNRFENYKVSNNLKNHMYFINQMKEYFNITKEIDINKTSFFKINDDKKNYLTCILTNEGNFYAVLEKGSSLPPNWQK